MGRYEYELLQLSQFEALNAAEKHRLLQSIRRSHPFNLMTALGHAADRVLHDLRRLFKGMDNHSVIHITTRRYRHSH